MIKKLLPLLICLTFLSGKLVSAQELHIKGSVVDSVDTPIPRINVLAHPVGSEEIFDFSITDNNGNYSIKLSDRLDSLDISYKGLSYKTQRLKIYNDGRSKVLIRNVILQSQKELLEEVLIEVERNVRVKEDTIVIRASAFREGNEEVLEDLLSKIPGLEVDADGTIRVGNKAIEKVMVEGDDFFGRGYKLLTKNMDHHGIQNIEIYKNYSNNKLLKGIENSDKVALNLTLKDEYKSEWFGNINGGYDALLSERYMSRINLMLFGKKNKFYLLSTLNNLGTESKGSIDDLVNSSEDEVLSDLGKDITTHDYFEEQEQLFYLGNRRTNFNNSKLVSLNGIFNLTDDLKVKTLAFNDWDRIDFFKNSTYQYRLNQVDFTNKEQKRSSRALRNIFGKAEIDYEFNNRGAIKWLSTVSNQNSHTDASLLFNDEAFQNRVASEKLFINQNIAFTQKLKDSMVLDISGRYITEDSPQFYSTNRNLENEFPGENDGASLDQHVQNNLRFFGFETNLLKRFKNHDLITLKTGYSNTQQKLYSFLEAVSDEEQSDYTNNLIFKNRYIYLGPSYSMGFKNLTLSSAVEFRSHFNEIQNEFEIEQDKTVSVNPSLGLNWKITKNQKLIAQYSIVKSPLTLPDIHPNYILSSYRELDRGVGSLEFLSQSNLVLNYTLGNWGDRFFANVFGTYTKRGDYTSTNSMITPEFDKIQKRIFKDQELVNIGSSLDYFIDPLSSNMKLKGGFTKSNFENIVNGNRNQIIATNSRIGFEYKSAFLGKFNFHLGSEWFISQVSSAKVFSTKRNLSFLDLNLNLSQKMHLSLRSESYHFNDDFNSKKPYLFLDFDLRYTIKKNKLSLQLHGENMLNTEQFTSSFVTDLSNNRTNYRIIPRYLLLKVNYRF